MKTFVSRYGNSDYSKLPSPLYLVYEEAIDHNLTVFDKVAKATGVKFILALKAFSHYPLFNLFENRVAGMTASSLNELQLASQKFSGEIHYYSPIIKEEEWGKIQSLSKHITFNSLSQWKYFSPKMEGLNCGIRINPEYSIVKTDLYNPCLRGGRLGVTATTLIDFFNDPINNKLPFPQGLHSHNLCESKAGHTIATLQQIEKLYGSILHQIRWLNLGGGHLLTKEGYNLDELIQGLNEFKSHYPNLQIIMEPGSAFLWKAGQLVSTVVDIVENGGIKSAMLDVSFACHMPDCLEMPYRPAVIGELLPEFIDTTCNSLYTYRLGGCSCLAGDYMGDFTFPFPLSVGDRVVFDDMFHYTMVKTTTFNGINRPTVGMINKKGKFIQTASYSFDDYCRGI